MKLFTEEEANILIKRLRSGDESAFNIIYEATFDSLYRKILTMVKDEMVTDELVQDLFVKLWDKRESISAHESFEHYLFTIARNLVYDFFRKAAKDQRLLAAIIENAVHQYTTLDILEWKEKKKILMDALDLLPPQRKQVFISCKLDGKSYEETGREMGISIATVNSHMTHAIRFIKSYLVKNYASSVVLTASAIAAAVVQHIK